MNPNELLQVPWRRKLSVVAMVVVVLVAAGVAPRLVASQSEFTATPSARPAAPA